jgi:hypothetical protein
MPKLIIKSGQFAGKQFELQPGLTSVGRGPENSISIPEPSISTFHCELNLADIGLAVHDLNSTNGTFINKKAVSKGMLQTGDVLTLGDVEFTVELPEVMIAIPEITIPEAPGAAFLDDGTPACFTHRNMAAQYRCTRCETWWCNECVRHMKKLSGDFLLFCPECSAACAPIPQTTIAAKRSFFQRVGDTLRLPRRK